MTHMVYITYLVYITYFMGSILVIGGAASALAYLRLENGNTQWLNVAYRAAFAALIALGCMILIRTLQWHLVPFTTAADSLGLLTFFSLLTIFVQLGRDTSHRALLCFYLPPLALLGALSLFVAVPTLSTAPKPVSGALLTAHVGLMFLAYALFFVAGFNSVAYAFQAQRLKHRMTTGLFQKLPSLECLDRDLFRLIRIGYPTFAVTLVVGGFWAWYEGDNLSPTWWLSPKIFMGLATLAFYAFTFHARAMGRLRGPRLAHLVCYGTATLIGSYLVLSLLNVLNYNFFGGGRMTISLTGFSHHTCPVELRERLSFPEDRRAEALRQLKQRLNDGGAVILSTCNRVEVYTHDNAAHPEHLRALVREFISEWHRLEPDDFTGHLYEHHNRDAVAHLFRVTSSLDSMVVGEDQILGQVHDAYLAAQSEGATDKILHALFQRAFKVAKEVRTKTNINVGKVSVSSVAVDLAASIFGNLSEKTVLVIGSGEMGELTLKCLVEKGVGKIMVANRTLSKAEEVAKAFHGEPLALSSLEHYLHSADIVITSTASEIPILGVDDFTRALRKRNQAPMFVIDIAVPRDVDPRVTQLDNVYCYDMDDLETVATQNLESRRAEMVKCLEMVERQVDRFIDWRRSLFAEPTIVSMTQELNAIRERELEKTLNMLPELTPRQRDEVEYLSKRIVNNILQRPMNQIKQEVVREDPSRVLHLVKRLFGLEESAG